jgi:hypothetical protein
MDLGEDACYRAFRTRDARFDPEGKKRPTEFKSAPGSANFVNIHKRVTK